MCVCESYMQWALCRVSRCGHACLFMTVCVFACRSDTGYTLPPLSPSGRKLLNSFWFRQVVGNEKRKRVTYLPALMCCRDSLSIVGMPFLLAGRVPLPLNRMSCFLQTWREAARLIFPAEQTASGGTEYKRWPSVKLSGWISTNCHIFLLSLVFIFWI